MFNTLPARFRHYEVQKLLGDGGFGRVYLACDLNLRRLVALKVLHPDLAKKQKMVSRFLREARVMASLHHANIVMVHRVENDSQPPFFEMEYVDGQTLADYRGSRILSLQEAIPFLKQMAAALDAAHEQGIVHRDVKPGNILIKPNGKVKLTDFGIIKLLQNSGTELLPTSEMIGTVGYMAPEQVDLSRKHEIGPATDIYALGVVAYEMLTGNLPFFGGHSLAILHAHAHTPPPDPRTINPDIPASVAEVLLKALNKPPADRYRRASEFVQALELGAWGRSRTNRPVTHPSAVAPSRPTATPPAIPIAPSVAPTTGWPSSATPVAPSVTPTTGWPAPATPVAQPVIPIAQRAISNRMIVGIVVMAIIFGGILSEFLSGADEPTLAPTAAIGRTIEAKDGMTLLYVPAGEFLMGSDEGDTNASDNERPQRTVYLDAFWIDQTEVSNEMFAAFLNQEGNQEEGGVRWLNLDSGTVLIEESGGTFQPKEGFANHPVIEVSWYGANAYCQWTGRRLPTEAEWEKAARGTDGRTYPWGNLSPSEDLLNFNRHMGGTTEVERYPDGASPYGALHMAGNVWEWTADWYDAEYYQDAPKNNPPGAIANELKVLRGGSWYDEARRVRAAYRAGDNPSNRQDHLGVRCAASP